MKGEMQTYTTDIASDAACVCCCGYTGHLPGAVPTPCCGRFVCGACVKATPRLATLCVLCQLPLTQDLWPPDYDAALPSYGATQGAVATATSTVQLQKEKETPASGSKEACSDLSSVQHYVRKQDSLTGLALAYQVDVQTLRKANHLFADHLLQARAFIIIPGASASLSPSPSEDEEHKVRLKKFMVQCKCTDYAMAQTYMNECNDNVQEAVMRYEADSEWTRTQHKKPS